MMIYSKKTLEMYDVVIFFRFFFNNNKKYYSQVFLDESLCK